MAIKLERGTWSGAIGLAGAGAIILLPDALWIGLFLLASAALLCLWGVRINGRPLWQLKQVFPLQLDAKLMPLNYEPGSDVFGIKWAEGFSHVHVRITNTSAAPVDDVTVLFKPEYPIIQSRVRCEFADCRIGLAVSPPQITTVWSTPDGKRRVTPHGDSDTLAFGPPHRLVCDRVPSGVSIDVHLATVRPLEEPSNGGFWEHERFDPHYVDAKISCRLEQRQEQMISRFSLFKGAPDTL